MSDLLKKLDKVIENNVTLSKADNKKLLNEFFFSEEEIGDIITLEEFKVLLSNNKKEVDEVRMILPKSATFTSIVGPLKFTERGGKEFNFVNAHSQLVLNAIDIKKIEAIRMRYSLKVFCRSGVIVEIVFVKTADWLVKDNVQTKVS